MNKEEILRRIDDMVIYEKDYPVLLNLLENTDDNFFVKVLEEIFNSNLFITDFEVIFSDRQYVETLRNNIEQQEALKQEIERLVDYRKNILGETAYSNNPLTTNLGIEKSSTNNPFYNEISTDVRQDLIYQMFSTSNIEASARYKILEAINTPGSGITESDLLLFKNDYIVPIDPRYQLLTAVDIDFMIKNNLNEDQMKKIKALSVFMKRKYYGS
jgi:hypothetical protein